MIGVLLVAGGERAPDQNDAEAVRRSGKGIAWALCSAVGFGVLFWLLGTRVVPRVGAPQTVWMIRLTSTVLTGVLIFLSKRPMSLPRGEVRGLALGMGTLDTGAFVLSNRGMQLEQVAVIRTLCSFYGAVTVGVAAIFLCENGSAWPWMELFPVF